MASLSPLLVARRLTILVSLSSVMGGCTSFIEGEPSFDSMTAEDTATAVASEESPLPGDMPSDEMPSVEMPSTETLSSDPSLGSTSGTDATETDITGEGAGADEASTDALEERLHPRLITLAGGTFVMGSPESEDQRDADEEEHVVVVNAFEICRSEVTNAHWEAVMGTPTPSDCTYGCEADVPVGNVEWDDAVVFLNRMTESVNTVRGGVNPLTLCYTSTETPADGWIWDRSCTGFRLPTEAEWEYAARAGTTTAYPFGDDDDALAGYGWHEGNSTDVAHVVGEGLPNGFDLVDMHGNMWEWVWDWYAPYPTDPPITDYAGPSTGTDRVERGGSFLLPSRYARSADRDFLRSGTEDNGIRCARGSGALGP